MTTKASSLTLRRLKIGRKEIAWSKPRDSVLIKYSKHWILLLEYLKLLDSYLFEIKQHTIVSIIKALSEWSNL